MMRAIELVAWAGQYIGKPRGWERLVRLIAPPESWIGTHDLKLIRDGTAFLVQPGVPLGWHVLLFGTYEPDVRNVFRKILRPGGVAIDAGANVGWHTLLMGRLVSEGGRVLAVEANPSVRKRLQENLANNNYKHVDVIPYALSDREQLLSFYGPRADDPDSGDGHVVQDGGDPASGIIHVEARMLDKIVADAGLQRIDLIKMDIEGFEWPALQGAERTIEKFHPHIIFEFDIASAPRGGGAAPVMTAFFARHRYRLFAVRRGGTEPLPDGVWPSCANIWAVPGNDATEGSHG